VASSGYVSQFSRSIQSTWLRGWQKPNGLCLLAMILRANFPVFVLDGWEVPEQVPHARVVVLGRVGFVEPDEGQSASTVNGR
jgi:hypothetical protein